MAEGEETLRQLEQTADQSFLQRGDWNKQLKGEVYGEEATDLWLLNRVGRSRHFEGKGTLRHPMEARDHGFLYQENWSGHLEGEENVWQSEKGTDHIFLHREDWKDT